MIPVRRRDPLFPRLHGPEARQQQRLGLGVLLLSGQAGAQQALAEESCQSSMAGTTGYNGSVPRISVRPDICHGKPCIQGTRIQVAQVIDLIAAGKSFHEVTTDYFPDLTDADVRACLEFARDLVC